MPVTKKDALSLFNEEEERVIVFDNGKKWFLPSFIDYQYPEELNPRNQVHLSVIKKLEKYNLLSSLQGAKVKVKDKVKVKEIDLKAFRKLKTSPKFRQPFFTWMTYKRDKSQVYKSTDSLQLAYNKMVNLSNEDPQVARKIVRQPRLID